MKVDRHEGESGGLAFIRKELERPDSVWASGKSRPTSEGHMSSRSFTLGHPDQFLTGHDVFLLVPFLGLEPTDLIPLAQPLRATAWCFLASNDLVLLSTP